MYARHHTYIRRLDSSRTRGYISTKLEAKLKHTKFRHVEESRMSKHIFPDLYSTTDEDQVDVK